MEFMVEDLARAEISTNFANLIQLLERENDASTTFGKNKMVQIYPTLTNL